MCLATMAYGYAYTAAQYVLLLVVLTVNSNRFQILVLHTLTIAADSHALLQ